MEVVRTIHQQPADGQKLTQPVLIQRPEHRLLDVAGPQFRRVSHIDAQLDIFAQRQFPLRHLRAGKPIFARPQVGDQFIQPFWHLH